MLTEFEALQAIENAIYKTVRDCLPHEWEEGHISLSLTKRLRTEFSHITINYGKVKKHVEWEYYKKKGTIENLYGDIAFIFNIKFENDELITGVAFLEAKKQYASNNFDAIDLDQLINIQGNAPSAHILYYLHSFAHPYEHFPYKWMGCHAWVSPIKTTVQLMSKMGTKNDIQLLQVAHPLSFQVIKRYFLGMDLEFGEDAIKAALTHAKIVNVVNTYYEGQSTDDFRGVMDNQDWQTI